MYNIIKFIENVFRWIKIKISILYWKLKYGKRIKIGRNFRFRKSLIINISKGGHLEIGNNNAFNNYCSINCHKLIKIGNNNMFGENVKIYDHNHIFNDKKISMKNSYLDKEIYIGNDNWIGSNVTILSKTKICDRNVIGANTVLNEEYKSENLIKNRSDLCIEKIRYKS